MGCPAAPSMALPGTPRGGSGRPPWMARPTTPGAGGSPCACLRKAPPSMSGAFWPPGMGASGSRPRMGACGVWMTNGGPTSGGATSCLRSMYSASPRPRMHGEPWFGGSARIGELLRLPEGSGEPMDPSRAFLWAPCGGFGKSRIPMALAACGRPRKRDSVCLSRNGGGSWAPRMASRGGMPTIFWMSRRRMALGVSGFRCGTRALPGGIAGAGPTLLPARSFQPPFPPRASA